MKTSNLVTKIVGWWVWLGESLTGMKYPSAHEKLGLGGIFRKSVMDFPMMTLVWIALSVYFFSTSTSGFTMLGPSLSVIGLLYFLTFCQWFLGEVLWAVFVWNPRARKLNKVK